MGACSSTESAKAVESSAPPKKQEVSQIDRAILDLKNARDKLHRYRQKLEQDDAKLLDRAKKAKDAGRKEQALGILRLRKYKQAQAASCEDQLLNVMQMVETIDSKQNETQVLNALSAGKDTLKQMHESTTVDDVLDLMDSIKDEIAVEQEINELLKGVPTLSDDDEEAAQAELEALMKQEEEQQQQQQNVEGDAQSVMNMPEPPNTKLPTVVATTNHHQEPIPAS